VNQSRVSGHRPFRVDDRWQHFVLHHDGVGGVPRNVAVPGHDDRHGLARVPDNVYCYGAMRR
jgi:hypothetical protein